MKRNTAYYRMQRRRIIRNKIRFLKRLGGNEYLYAWSRDKPGRLSKGKIHCSCWMCRKKSYDHISHRDEKHKIAAIQQFIEYRENRHEK